MNQKTIPEGYTSWVLTRYDAPSPTSVSDEDLAAKIEALGKAKGMSPKQIEQFTQNALRSTKELAVGGTSIARIDCNWNKELLAVSRQFTTVRGRVPDIAFPPENVLFYGQDYINKIGLLSLDFKTASHHTEVIPRSGQKGRIVLGGIFDRCALSDLDTNALFPEGSYSIVNTSTEIIWTRLFSYKDKLPGTGIRAVYSKSTGELLSLSQLAPDHKEYEHLNFKWGSMAGVRLPVTIKEVVTTGAGQLVLSLSYVRKDFSLSPRNSALENFFEKGEMITDCRFGMRQQVSYRSDGRTLPSDSEVRKMLDKVRQTDQSASSRLPRSILIFVTCLLIVSVVSWTIYLISSKIIKK